MTSWVIIGARSGSKSIPNKNVLPLMGKTLLEHAINYGHMLVERGNVYVSTDSEDYARKARGAGANTVIRPESISGDLAEDVCWVYHLIGAINEQLPDNLILLRPTTPIRNVHVVLKALDEWLPSSFDSLRSVQELPDAAEKIMYVRPSLHPGYKLLQPIKGPIVESNKPRQAFEKVYHPNGYIDIVKPEVVVEQHSLYGLRIQAYITPKTIEIDDMEDYELAIKVVKK